MPNNNELWKVEWQPGIYPQKPFIKKTTAELKAKEESKL